MLERHAEQLRSSRYLHISDFFVNVTHKLCTHGLHSGVVSVIYNMMHWIFEMIADSTSPVQQENSSRLEPADKHHSIILQMV